MNWLELTELEEQTGRLWHQMIGKSPSYRHYPEAAVSLNSVRTALGIFFRGLGGAPGVAIIAGTPQASAHRLTLRQRLGLMQESLDPIECNTERMLLPEALDYFPESDLNRQHYFWLAAFFATVNNYNYSSSLKRHDPLQADLAFLHQAYWTSIHTSQRYPGLAQNYRRLCAAIREQRPHRPLTAQEQAIESVIQVMLGAQLCTHASGDDFLQAVQQPVPDFTSWHAAKNYRAFLPVPLWGKINTHQKSMNARPDALDDSAGQSTEADEKQRKKKSRREKQDQSTRDDPLLLNRFEKMLSWSEMVNVNRAVQDDEESAAKDAAEALEEITLSPNEQRAATRLKFDLDLSPDDVNPAILISELVYPEWDFRRKQYHSQQCRIIFQHATEGIQHWEPDLQARKRFRKIRRQFEALQPKREKLHRQLDGAELDMDALVRARCDLHATGNSSDRIYLNTRQQSRDLSVAILMDVSLSTDSWISGRRILDIEKEALITLATGLATCRDTFAIYTFTSRKRDYVRVTEVKDFDEAFDTRTLRRIAALHPGYYTRMGAALRHTSKLLAHRTERHRLLLLLTDGKPNDLDYYEGRYGVEDTRQAIIEARHAGLSVFGITIDHKAQDYFPYLFGKGGYTIVARPDRLSHILPVIYQHLIQ
ncbi:nitric oxide reductase NorD protein [Nitrosomonas sp. Nm84]|uniref:nitric oxide reductase activation protein NorD n=1 Tax=Nitrosomonas sp. Nm84 TaxID=200124 RepID=UPI000D7547D7|nr:VWA domain-containing protein [Nitrosomonas sp. Nm84]PXW88234.1 nitric oxide reductase NorD protein [Nitrosomonas sp. Nm84]